MVMPVKPGRWTGFRSVLCPIDFSEQSRLALRYAVAIALRSNAVLRITSANDPLLVAAAAAALHDRSIAKRSAKELRAFVASTLSGGSRKRLRVSSHVSTGHPSAEIMKAVARHRSDLIVMGTHGLTGADRLLIGSTTLSILQRTTVPVLAIPHAAPALAASWPGERIVAALELDNGSGREVDIAARIAQSLGVSLLLLHVVNEVVRPDWLRRDLAADERIRVAQAQQEIDALVAKARYRVTTDGRVVCGRVSDEIAALAAAERTGLLITALRDRRGWFGSRRGSVSYHILSRAPTPVLAYPTHWRPR